MRDKYAIKRYSCLIHIIHLQFLKITKKSWFERLNLNSIVLQMVICGDMEVIAECVHRKDYEIIDNDTK